MTHVAYHLLRLTMPQVIRFQYANTVLSTDASSLLFDVVKDERLESFSYCFGALHVVKSFHYCV